MAAGLVESKTNGYSSHDLDQDALASAYDALIKLKDAVLAGEHPRLKLSAAARDRILAAVRTEPSQLLNGAAPPVTNGFASYARDLPSTFVGNDSAFAANSKSHANGTLTQQQQKPALPAPQKPTTASGINPLLLTKSDDLIRAETHLKRQRIEQKIERDAKDAGEQRRHGARDKDFGAEPASLVNLQEIFDKALELVKPISGIHPVLAPHDESSTSFDENSYYSSQVNDWSSESAASNAAGTNTAITSSTANGLHQAQPVASVTGHAFPGLASSVSHSNARAPAFDQLDKQAHASLQPNGSPQQARSHFYAQDSEDVYEPDGEESDYSPPAADAFTDADVDAMDIDDDDESEYTPQADEAKSPHVPVITNHLTQIAAPQPARVSPLAVAKAPGLESPQLASQSITAASPYHHNQNTHAPLRPLTGGLTTSPRNSGPHTPAGPLSRAQKTNSKKRKRDLDPATKPKKLTRAQKRRAQNAAASPPRIKEEPVSPPPFAFGSDPRHAPPARNVYQSYPDVEIVSPGDFRPRTAGQYQHPPSQVPSYPLEATTSPAGVHVASAAVPYGRVRRDDQDLRRVASMHATYQPHSPPGARAYSPVAPYRTASLQYPDSRVALAPVYRDDFIRPQSSHRIRPETAISPPQVREVRDPYAQRLQSPAVMAPPPPPARKIIVDQYGNKYYAAETAQPPRASVAPQPRPEPEIVYERAPSRASVAYAPRPAPSGYGNEEMVAMPPPPRRIVSRAAMAPAGLEYQDYRPRESSVRPVDHQYYTDSMPPPAVRRAVSHAPMPPPEYDPPRAVRQYSVRPEPQAYELGAPPSQLYLREPPPSAMIPQTRQHIQYEHDPSAGAYISRGYSARPDVEPGIRYGSRQASMAPQFAPQPRQEYAYRPESGAPPMRAVSVMPGTEYAPRHGGEVRYSYAPSGAAAGQPGVRYYDEG